MDRDAQQTAAAALPLTNVKTATAVAVTTSKLSPGDLAASSVASLPVTGIASAGKFKLHSELTNYIFTACLSYT